MGANASKQSQQRLAPDAVDIYNDAVGGRAIAGPKSLTAIQMGDRGAVAFVFGDRHTGPADCDAAVGAIDVVDLLSREFSTGIPSVFFFERSPWAGADYEGSPIARIREEFDGCFTSAGCENQFPSTSFVNVDARRERADGVQYTNTLRIVWRAWPSKPTFIEDAAGGIELRRSPTNAFFVGAAGLLSADYLRGYFRDFAGVFPSSGGETRSFAQFLRSQTREVDLVRRSIGLSDLSSFEVDEDSPTVVAAIQSFRFANKDLVGGDAAISTLIRDVISGLDNGGRLREWALRHIGTAIAKYEVLTTKPVASVTLANGVTRAVSLSDAASIAFGRDASDEWPLRFSAADFAAFGTAARDANLRLAMVNATLLDVYAVARIAASPETRRWVYVGDLHAEAIRDGLAAVGGVTMARATQMNQKCVFVPSIASQ